VRQFALPLVLCIIVAVGVALWLLQPSRIDDSQIEVRFTNLQDVVASQRVFYKKAIDEYVPKVLGTIDDLAVPAAEILRKLPGVASVEQPLKPAKVSDRLVHLRDWHFITKEWFAKDTGLSAGKPLTDNDLDLRYQEFLLQVELVQMEHLAILRCLIRHHGVRPGVRRTACWMTCGRLRRRPGGGRGSRLAPAVVMLASVRQATTTRMTHSTSWAARN
jgi:hypothetical protein